MTMTEQKLQDLMRECADVAIRGAKVPTRLVSDLGSLSDADSERVRHFIEGAKYGATQMGKGPEPEPTAAAPNCWHRMADENDKVGKIMVFGLAMAGVLLLVGAFYILPVLGSMR